MKRRLIVGGLLLTASIEVGLLLCSLAGGASSGDALGGVPFPRHIEWTQYTVPEAGWTLCRPATDTTEVCIPLSPGTEVYVPRWVAGRGQDGDQDYRNRSIARRQSRPPEGGYHD